MKYRQLGVSGLQVPVISLGSWLTYSGGVEKRQAIACIHKSLDLGINFFDTANVYGRGAAESVLGEALHGIDRTSYMLATKFWRDERHGQRAFPRADLPMSQGSSLFVANVIATAFPRWAQRRGQRYLHSDSRQGEAFALVQS